MKNHYVVAQTKNKQGEIVATVLKIGENDNLVSKLQIPDIFGANIFATKKLAVECCEKLNDFHTPKLVLENGKLVFKKEGKTQILWTKEPQLVDDETLTRLAKANAYSEWNRESAKFENFVSTDNPDIIRLVKDWQKVGTSKYGRKCVSRTYGLKRSLDFGEFYGGGVVD